MIRTFVKIPVVIYWIIACFYSSPNIFLAKAVVNPLNTPNNYFGIHILQPDEIFQAAKLVNSSGGTWGYVTIPIRSDDRNFNKWFSFFNQCTQNNVIPIIRLATYIDGDEWVTPTDNDLVDFANFLNQMPWPTKNRYVIIFNEPNHSNEWGGDLSPSEYANILIDAKDIFKSRSDDFFILNAGLDMSAPNSATSMDALLFLRRMSNQKPLWYQAIDGFASHAYPNPGFSSSPLNKNRYSLVSYRFEQNLLKTLGYPSKPIFITETGYTGDSQFYNIAFNQIWQDKNIVAITPFVLFAGAGDFTKFSFIDKSHQPKKNYQEYYGITKIKGSPLLNNSFPHSSETSASTAVSDNSGFRPPNFIQNLYNFIFPPSPSLLIGSTKVKIRIADTPSLRQKGLSGIKNLATDSGMLFIFPEFERQTFWMKDMYIPLDFIWINNHKIIQINENIPPPVNTNGIPWVLQSIDKVNMVLEVNAGFVRNHSLQVGNEIMLNSP